MHLLCTQNTHLLPPPANAVSMYSAHSSKNLSSRKFIMSVALIALYFMPVKEPTVYLNSIEIWTIWSHVLKHVFIKI